MVKEKPITVYIASGVQPQSHGVDWSFLYPKPKLLFSSLLENKNKESKRDSFFSCPAFSDFSKKTLEYYSPISCSYKYDFGYEKNNFYPITENYISTKMERVPALKNGNSVIFELKYIMFADQPLNVFFTSPHFSKSTYTQYGSVLPGRFDIGQWFRPFNFEVQLWDDSGEFHLVEGEPIFYSHFETEKTVIFKSFNLNDKLSLMSGACMNTQGLFGRGQSLLSRYKRFNNVGMKEKIITEIKKNLIEE
jgi:hypothetical protein